MAVIRDTRWASYRAAINRVPAGPAKDALDALAVSMDWIRGINGGQSPLLLSSSSSGASGSPVDYSATTKGNTAAVETDLFSTSLSAGALSANGEALIVTAAGTIAGTAAVDKRLRFYLGATQLYDSGSMPLTTAQAWIFRATILRVSATSQKAHIDGTYALAYGTAAENLAGALTLRLTGSGTNASDVVGEMWKVWVEA